MGKYFRPFSCHNLKNLTSYLIQRCGKSFKYVLFSCSLTRNKVKGKKKSWIFVTLLIRPIRISRFSYTMSRELFGTKKVTCYQTEISRLSLDSMSVWNPTFFLRDYWAAWVMNYKKGFCGLRDKWSFLKKRKQLTFKWERRFLETILRRVQGFFLFRFIWFSNINNKKAVYFRPLWEKLQENI